MDSVVKAMKNLTLALVALAIAAQADATVILDYTGNNFNDFFEDGVTAPPDVYSTSDALTVSLLLADVLPPNLSGASVDPLAFTLSDGVNTITDANATRSLFFGFSTDATGQVVQWSVGARFDAGLRRRSIDSVHLPGSTRDQGLDRLCGPTSMLPTCSLGGDPYYTQAGGTSDNPGVWRYQTGSVAEPGTVFALVLGILGLVGYARRTSA